MQTTLNLGLCHGTNLLFFGLYKECHYFEMKIFQAVRHSKNKEWTKNYHDNLR